MNQPTNERQYAVLHAIGSMRLEGESTPNQAHKLLDHFAQEHIEWSAFAKQMDTLAEGAAPDQAQSIRKLLHIVDIRIHPTDGQFDFAHLRAIHQHIFFGMNDHRPGEYRPEGSWNKNRILEAHAIGYRVNYCEEFKAKLDGTLATLQDIGFWRRLDEDSFARAFARLYGDLDYCHPFCEGNSRTLRVFTEQFVRATGHRFRWISGQRVPSAVARNRLYLARDIEVLQRFYGGLTPEQGLALQKDGYQVEEFMYSKKRYLGDRVLEDLIRDNAIATDEP